MLTYDSLNPFLPIPELKPDITESSAAKVNQVHPSNVPLPSPQLPTKQVPSTTTMKYIPPVTTTRAGHVVKPINKLNL